MPHKYFPLKLLPGIGGPIFSVLCGEAMSERASKLKKNLDCQVFKKQFSIIGLFLCEKDQNLIDNKNGS